jgi:hypothetical protein
MYGNPKVSTSNETTMTVSTVELKDIISFDNLITSLMKIKK